MTLLGMHADPRSTPTSDTFFRKNFGHANISTTVLPEPQLQVEQLSVNSKRMYAKNGCTTFRLNPCRRMDNSSNTTICLKKGFGTTLRLKKN